MTGHWDEVYSAKDRQEVSWFQDDPRVSLELIRESGIAKDAAIVDVGGGASALGSRLPAEGFTDVAVLDIATSALDAARDELGFTGNTVVADVREWRRADRYRLWHDRTAYCRTLDATVEAEGWVAIATFAAGLPTTRYDAEALVAEFAGWEAVRPFTWLLLRRRETSHVSRETSAEVSRETSRGVR